MSRAGTLPRPRQRCDRDLRQWFDIPGFRVKHCGVSDAIDGDRSRGAMHRNTGRRRPCRVVPAGEPYRASHGTAVAGVAAARGNNRALGSGVCPRCGPTRSVLGGGGAALSQPPTLPAPDGAVINNSLGPSLTRFFHSRAESEAPIELQGRPDGPSSSSCCRQRLLYARKREPVCLPS